MSLSTPDLTGLPTAPIVAASLIGGYAVGRKTGIRPLAGVVLAAGGALATTAWYQVGGAGPAAALLGVYLGSFGASHPAAKKVGAWPAVLGAAGVSAAAAHLLSDSRRGG